MEIGEGEPASYESLPPELIKKIVEKSWPFGDGINKATQKAYEEVKREKLEEEYLKRRILKEVPDAPRPLGLWWMNAKERNDIVLAMRNVIRNMEEAANRTMAMKTPPEVCKRIHSIDENRSVIWNAVAEGFCGVTDECSCVRLV
eukprot:jgi/Mesvir1/12576/Mv19469-RA.1